MDRERCLLILEGYDAGLHMVRLICNFWRDTTMVCCASGNYGELFCAGQGMTQGGPLSAKLFNILVDAVVREWLRQLRDSGIVDPEELDLLMAAFFAIFFVDDAYLAARDPNFLQVALNSLVSLFECVGLETNIAKMQAMICTPGQITTQLLTDSYRCRRGYGTHTREQWDARKVECRQCQAKMNASSLSRHLADLHEVYQQMVVVEELLDNQAGMLYRATTLTNCKISCPYPGCVGGGTGIKLDVEMPLPEHTPKGSGNCAKGARVPALQEMQHAGELCLPKAHLHKGVRNGHGKMTTARSGGGLSTGPSLSVHSARGCPQKGQGLQLPQQDDGTG